MTNNQFQAESKQPLVSICILNYNGRKYIDPCLAAIEKLDYPKDRFEVIFVDNASQDDSVEYVRQRYPTVKIVANSENYGFAEGNNIGSEACQGEYVVFLNNDTMVDARWLSELVKATFDFPEAKFFGSKIYIQGKNKVLNSAGFCITAIGSGYDRGFGRPDSQDYSASRYAAGVSGASLMVQREYFEKMGGFDKDYFMYFEDVDLCLRNWLYGGKCAYVSDSIVYHAVGGTSGKHRNNFRLYFATRNRLYTLIKNYSSGQIAVGLIVSAIFDFLILILSLVRLNPKGPVIIFKAYLNFLPNLPKLIAKRKFIKKNRVNTPTYLKKIGVIDSLPNSVKEYFRVIKAT
ncbi:MAG: glycosyltransferase family 2 protein [Patescibacteria group bacterium]|nr:glycosyltransferase family 2 protein [Patescibacteria group bacterium]